MPTLLSKVELKDYFDAFTKTHNVCEHIDLTLDNEGDLTIQVEKEPIEEPKPDEPRKLTWDELDEIEEIHQFEPMMMKILKMILPGNQWKMS